MINGYNFVSRTNTLPLFQLAIFEDHPRADWGAVFDYYGTSDYGGGLSGGGTGTKNTVGVFGWAADYTGYGVGIAGMARTGGTNTIGGYFTTAVSSSPVPNKSAVVVLDSIESNLPLLIACTNNGTQVFQIAASGLTSANAGFSSSAIDAPLEITATGRTNTLGKNAVARMDGTNLVYVVKNNAGTAIYTNSIAVGRATELLQSGGALVITSGTLTYGNVTPF